jgi:hypothetical protein
VRLLIATALLASSISCARSAPFGPWTIDAGIYGTYDHFGNPPNGPPTFICGVGYDLRYHGVDAIQDLDVAIRYPPAFASLAVGAGDLSAWVRPIVTVSGAGSLAEAARVGHASGAMGAICPGGVADLETLRGTALRLSWRSVSGSHEQEFTIDDIRGNMRVYGGQLSPDGQPRIVWERH